MKAITLIIEFSISDHIPENKSTARQNQTNQIVKMNFRIFNFIDEKKEEEEDKTDLNLLVMDSDDEKNHFNFKTIVDEHSNKVSNYFTQPLMYRHSFHLRFTSVCFKARNT